MSRWLHRAFLKQLGLSAQDALSRVQGRVQRHQLPLALVALIGREPVGTASLLIDEHPTEPRSVCCLAGLYVVPAFRGRGLGATLVQRCVAEAGQLGYPSLCLLTTDAEGFYAGLGWRKRMDTVTPGRKGPELCAFMEIMTRSVRPY